MLAGIDHLVVAVADPDAAVEELGSRLGLEPGGGGTHPSWGTSNRLLWLGDTYVELLGVEDTALAARSWLGAPALAALPTGPALVAWAIASDDLDADAATMRELGAGLSPPSPGERRRPDGRVVRWRLSLPPSVSLERPFLIEHDTIGAEWTPADRGARAAPPGRVTGLSLPVHRLYGLTFDPHDNAVVIGPQRVVLDRQAAEPTVHLRGLGPAERFRALGCSWSME